MLNKTYVDFCTLPNAIRPHDSMIVIYMGSTKSNLFVAKNWVFFTEEKRKLCIFLRIKIIQNTLPSILCVAQLPRSLAHSGLATKSALSLEDPQKPLCPSRRLCLGLESVIIRKTSAEFCGPLWVLVHLLIICYFKCFGKLLFSRFMKTLNLNWYEQMSRKFQIIIKISKQPNRNSVITTN